MIVKILILALLCFFVTPYNIHAKDKVDILSLITTPIFLYNNNDLVSQGAGFYTCSNFEKDNISVSMLFLVTNYHVLTGHSPDKKSSPIGNNIVFHIHTSAEDPKLIKKIRRKLFSGKGMPLWLVSEKYPIADVAVFPVTSVQSCNKVFAMDKNFILTKNLRIKPTSTVTVIGYPYGYYDSINSLPVWKTGHIASEPSIDLEGTPSFLIDISAFPGMSGAPVFAISESSDGGGGLIAGGRRNFIGIYASMKMLNENKFLEEIELASKFGMQTSTSLELGRIWKKELIVDIMESMEIQKYVNNVLNMN